MLNVFVTRRQHNVKETGEIQYVTDSLGRQFPIESPLSNTKIKITDSLNEYHYMMKNNHNIGLDTENNNLNQFYAIPLLIQLAIPGLSIVIDQTSVKEDFLSMYKDKLFIGHNIQYDYRIIKYLMGVELLNLEDIMVTEQIINRGSGRLNNLQDAYLRRTGKYLPEDKNTRNDFIRMNEKSIFETKHIIYSGFDPQTGLEIREIQKEILDTYKLNYRVFNIGMPLIPILGDMNIEGIHLDQEKWKAVLDENKKKKFELELQLDAIVKEFSKESEYLRGGIWTRKRKKEEGEQFNLFGESKTIGNLNDKNISYSSNKQLVKLFSILKEPMPQKKKIKDDEVIMIDSFAEEALEQYKIKYPSSRVYKFINLLLKYREVEKEINSFGEIFLKEFVKAGKTGNKSKRGYFQPKTNNVHTIYKQEFTKNGRLSSGEGRNKKGELGLGFFNSQQIVKKNKFRNCFTLSKEEIASGWYMSTSDLSGAELVILASKSQDKKLIEFHDKDLHSYLATFSYQRMIDYILSEMNEGRAYDELYNLLKVNRLQPALRKKIGENESGESIFIDLTQEEEDTITKQRVENIFNTKKIIIDKKIFPDIREPYKNCTYGVTYGAGEGKIAETLNIAPYFAKLTMEGIYNAIPDAMKFLDRTGRKAVKDGYVVFNERTNSRHWFKSWIDARTAGRELRPKEIGSIERFSKNAVMSGTQADMIKEGMVEIDKFIRKEKIPFKWLMQVHDEIVTKHKDKDLRTQTDKILIDTCNKYLVGVQMKVSGYTGYEWNKD